VLRVRITELGVNQRPALDRFAADFPLDAGRARVEVPPEVLHGRAQVAAPFFQLLGIVLVRNRGAGRSGVRGKQSDGDDRKNGTDYHSSARQARLRRRWVMYHLATAARTTAAITRKIPCSTR